jgi:hypothetical protein
MSANANVACFGNTLNLSMQAQSSNGGNSYFEAANNQTLQRVSTLQTTSHFTYSVLYTYNLLAGTRLTQQPNTGINTRVPYTP